MIEVYLDCKAGSRAIKRAIDASAAIVTHVLDLRTGTYTYTYTLPADQAVVCAWYQDQGDYNTWGYDFNKAIFHPSGRSVHCGNFSAIVPAA